MDASESGTIPLHRKVLVVEDDRVLRRVIADHLMQEGFEVLEAEDGAAGLAIAFAEHPSVLLLDVVMPKMDGMMVLEKLRADEWGKTANVIMLTNLNDPETMSRAREKGVTEYLVKADWDIQDIIKKVKEKLR